MARHLLHFVITIRDSGSHASGSIGMLFVVLVIIIVLGLLAGLLARVCGGRHFAGHIEYDFEGWVERKCASCIDGSLPAPPAPPAAPKEAKATEGDAKATEEKKPEEKKGDDAGAGGGGEKKEESKATDEKKS